MILPGGPKFDTAAYLAHTGLGRRIVQVEPKQAHLLFTKWPGKDHGRIASRKRSDYHDPQPGRFCRRRVTQSDPWAAIGYGHRHHGLHCAED